MHLKICDCDKNKRTKKNEEKQKKVPFERSVCAKWRQRSIKIKVSGNRKFFFMRSITLIVIAFEQKYEICVLKKCDLLRVASLINLLSNCWIFSVSAVGIENGRKVPVRDGNSRFLEKCWRQSEIFQKQNQKKKFPKVLKISKNFQNS